MSSAIGRSELNAFLDGVAQRRPTPGGGGVTAATGALACAMARMVAVYSPSKDAAPEAHDGVTRLSEQLTRADQLLRESIDEDARAYVALTEAAKRAGEHDCAALRHGTRQDPVPKLDHETALGVAIAVPLQVAALAAEALSVMQRLIPVANRHLLSDLGVAAVLADATVRAASYMVRVNTASLSDAHAKREPEREIEHLIARSGKTLAGIEAELRELV